MDKKKEYFIFGAGGAGKAVAAILLELKDESLFCGFLDDDKALSESEIFNKQIFTDYEGIIEKDNNVLFIAVGSIPIRKYIFDRINSINPSLFNDTIIHPKAIVNPRVRVGKACIVYPGVIFDPDVEVKNNVMINKGTSIGHDVTIDSHSIISPNCSIGGNVHIGENTFIGMNCCIKQGLQIGAGVIIGMGSVIIKDIPDKAVVVGNPGRIIKYSN